MQATTGKNLCVSLLFAISSVWMCLLFANDFTLKVNFWTTAASFLPGLYDGILDDFRNRFLHSLFHFCGIQFERFHIPRLHGDKSLAKAFATFFDVFAVGLQQTSVLSRLFDQCVGIHRLASTRNGLEIQFVSCNLDEHECAIRVETLDRLG